MDKDHDLNSPCHIETQLQEISATVLAVANKCQGNSRLLLSILRTLELLHRDISQQMFQPSLPNTRHALYLLLKDIEETGGWPYIERMKIQALVINLEDKTSNFEKKSP